MPSRTLIAFSSNDPIVVDTIVTACDRARRTDTSLEPWNRFDPSGNPIDQSVFSWVETADRFVGDISEPNHNVTYEIGLAFGMRKPVRLIRATSKDLKQLVSVGLLHNLGHDEYESRDTLARILEIVEPDPIWPKQRRNREQPIYFVQMSVLDDLHRRTASHIKKSLKLKYRTFNPREIDRLTATEAFDQVSQSFGVIATWDPEDSPISMKQNQRAAFSVGVARGLDIPFLLLADETARLPLDIDEVATRWAHVSDLTRIMREFRDEVYEAQESFVESRDYDGRFLDRVYCGDPAAENEQDLLSSYFLETEQFRLTMSGDLNIVLGRKGSGKTAVFLQVRNRVREIRSNIVVDLQPEGYQLIQMKEFVLRQLELGARKEFIASFWEYIVWLEIAHKLLEKDERRTRYDSRILPAYDRLREAYVQRVEGSGDFAERLAALVDRICGRFSDIAGDANPLSSSRILEVVYGSEIRSIREEVLQYLKTKGLVFFLFDNIDRFWTAPGFDELDASIVVGLIESLADVRKRFARSDVEFYWAVFLRSDVFEFVIRGMSDYGKLSVDNVEWNDPALLRRLFRNRVLSGLGADEEEWDDVWNAVSVQYVGARRTLDHLVESSLMRPRYLIRLFETARRRAITLGKVRIDESDYEAAVDELGWQVLEDFDRELADVVPDVEDLIFDIVQLDGPMSFRDLQSTIKRRVQDPNVVERIVDVLIWTGCIGVAAGAGVTYISDCGFKRPYMRALLSDVDANNVVFHPTIAAIVGSPT